VTVRVVKPGPGGLEIRSVQWGDVRAFDSVDLLPVVSGVLKDQTVDIGDRVKKGQVLATVSSPLLGFEEEHAAAVLKQAKGQLQGQEARIMAAQAEVVAAKTVVKQRQADVQSAKAGHDRWRSEVERLKKLHKDGVVDKSVLDETETRLLAAQGQLDAAKAALESAKADVAVKEAKLTQTKADLIVARAAVQIAEVAVEKARYMVNLGKIVSPVDGVVTKRNFRNGHYLRSGDQGGQLPLLTIQRVDLVRLIVEVPENVLPLTEPGTPVELRFHALPGVKFPDAKVSRIGFAENPKTRTMLAEIDIPNPKAKIRPGMEGRATLVLKGAENAVRVPLTALTPAQGGKQAVYVVRDGKARRTMVVVGERNDKEAEVLSGLTREDTIVAKAEGLRGEVVPVEVVGKSSEK
jgi:HlyD family secretion protein